MIIEFIYTGKCYLEEQELAQFLSVGIELGVNGILEEIVNDANIAMEDYDSEIQSNKIEENISEQRGVPSRDIVKEKGKRVINEKGNYLVMLL